MHSSVADRLPTMAALNGLVAVAVLGNRHAAAFCVAVITMLHGSPAVSIDWYILLYALLAPVAWPILPVVEGTAGLRISERR